MRMPACGKVAEKKKKRKDNNKKRQKKAAKSPTLDRLRKTDSTYPLQYRRNDISNNYYQCQVRMKKQNGRKKLVSITVQTTTCVCIACRIGCSGEAKHRIKSHFVFMD